MRDYYFNEDKSDEKKRLLGRVCAYSELGMYKEAISECKKIIRLDPNDPSPFVDLGYNCEEDGYVDRAIKYYRYAIRKFPAPSNALSRLYTNLGYCYGKYKKRDDLEIVCCEKALKMDPYNEWALNNIAGILEKKGRRIESLLCYEKAYEACKHKYGAVCDHITHNFAWALYRCKKYTRAWLIYKYLVNECPDKPHVICDFGRVNYKMGAYGEALEYFSKALSISPGRHYRRLYRVAYKKIDNPQSG